MSRFPRIILLPGLGADARLFEPQQREFPQLTVPSWIPPKPHESLSDYAVRMAEAIRPLLDGPCVLGGVSFGGMAAYEIARHLKPDAVVLIASCRRQEGLRPIYRLGRRLLPLLPAATWRLAKWLASPVLRMTCPMDSVEREMLVTMFRQMDSRFMHWVLNAILEWRPEMLQHPRVYQIHGGRDPILPARRAMADAYIPEGGHLINITHAEQVNDFLRRVCCELEAETHTPLL